MTHDVLSALPEADRPTGKQILVTGGAGFIGSHLVDALVSDNEVRVFDNLSSGHAEFVHDDAELIEGDIRDRAAVAEAAADVDIVYHFAANVSVQRSVEQPAESHDVNLSGTVNVLEAARQADARVVFASSAAIYGDPEYIPIDEEHQTEPLSPYGLEKLSSDRYVRLYTELYDLPTVALRYFNVFGPRQTGEYAGVISVFLEQAREGRELTVHGDGSQTRDFVFVDDVVQANLLAGTTDATGRAFNIGTGESISIRGLAEVVQSLGDESPGIRHESAREGDIDASKADITRAMDEFGFTPEYELREGLSTIW